MGFAPIEDRNFMSAADGVTYRKGPVKPVPPRIEIFRGFTALPIEPARFFAASKSDAPGNNPKPKLPPARAESLRNLLLVVDIHLSPKQSFDLISKCDETAHRYSLRVVKRSVSDGQSDWIRVPYRDCFNETEREFESILLVTFLRQLIRIIVRLLSVTREVGSEARP